MSVIINALNLNKEKQRTNPPPPSGAPQSHPGERPSPETSRFRLTLPALVFGLLLFTFVLLGMIFVRAISRQNELQVTAKTTPATTAPAKHTGATPIRPARPGATMGGSTSAAPASLTGSTNTAAASKPAPLRLQAVFYDPKRPSAIISGKTVVVGDEVQSYRVTEITVNSATLVAGVKTNVLTLY